MLPFRGPKWPLCFFWMIHNSCKGSGWKKTLEVFLKQVLSQLAKSHFLSVHLCKGRKKRWPNRPVCGVVLFLVVFHELRWLKTTHINLDSTRRTYLQGLELMVVTTKTYHLVQLLLLMSADSRKVLPRQKVLQEKCRVAIWDTVMNRKYTGEMSFDVFSMKLFNSIFKVEQAAFWKISTKKGKVPPLCFAGTKATGVCEPCNRGCQCSAGSAEFCSCFTSTFWHKLDDLSV